MVMPLRAAALDYSPLDSRRQGGRVVRLHRGGVVWRVRESWRERLLGPGSPDWLNLEQDPRAARVKGGHGRMTWRVTIGDGAVYAKVLESSGALDRLKRWVVGSAAEREWHASREAEARGVPVARCLAVGTSERGTAQTLFLSEGWDGAVTLPDSWERNVAKVLWSRRRGPALSLIDAIADLFSHAHERGFVHGDGHPHNILVRTTCSGELEAVYVDVHSASLSRHPASLHRSLCALAQLDRYFHRRATRTERLRFFREYMARRGSLSSTSGEFPYERKCLGSLAKTAALQGERLARGRDRRMRRRGKYFSTFRLNGGWRASVVLRLERRHVFPEPDVPDRTEADWRGILEPLAARTGKKSEPGDPADHNDLYIEESVPGRLIDRMLSTLGKSPQRRAFQRCHELRHRDVPSELILAYAEHRSDGLVDATVLIRPRRARSRSDSAEHTPGRRHE